MKVCCMPSSDLQSIILFARYCFTMAHTWNSPTMLLVRLGLAFMLSMLLLTSSSLSSTRAVSFGTTLSLLTSNHQNG